MAALQPMSEREYQRLYFEGYHLPAQMERARAKLAMLEDRARKHGLVDLLVDPRAADASFELEVARAYAANQECRR